MNKPIFQPRMAQLGTRPTCYHDQTLRPLVSLVFVLPLMLTYELCGIWLGSVGLRSGIDQWLDHWMGGSAAGHFFILPIVTAGVLLWWHHHRRDAWQLDSTTPVKMLLESAGLGLILFCAAKAFHIAALAGTGPPIAALPVTAVPTDQWWTTLLASVGSGIHEELVFRLLLLMPLIHLLHGATANPRLAQLGGIVLVSLLFAASHYDLFNPAGVPLNAGSFVFRFLASIIFSVLFLFRGFGIAVGTHVVYDILAQT